MPRTKKKKKTPVVAEEYDSDHMPYPDDPVALTLDWRLDPQESLSDWTIEIVTEEKPKKKKRKGVKGGKEPNEYHVHRCVLVSGKRRSDYFARLFDNGSFKETQSNKSVIELDPLAAEAFPCMLDYLYTSSALKISTQNAVPLYHLSKYFEVQMMRYDAKTFMQRDLAPWPYCIDDCWKDIWLKNYTFAPRYLEENLDAAELETLFSNTSTYFLHARIFHEETVLNAVKALVVTFLLHVGADDDVVKDTDEEFWIAVMEDLKPVIGSNSAKPPDTFFWSSRFVEVEEVIEQAGEIVAGVCRHHGDMSQESLHKLVSPGVLLSNDPNLALEFLEMEARFPKPDGGISDVQKQCFEILRRKV